MITKLNNTKIKLLQTVEALRSLAYGFSITGNTFMQAELTKLAVGIEREIDVIGHVMDEDLNEKVRLAQQSSENVLNAALAGIELASRKGASHVSME